MLERLKKHFNFQIVDIISVHEAKNLEPQKADFIISTVPLADCRLDYVIVSPLLNDEDYIRVGNKIDNLRNSRNLPVRAEEHEITARGLLEKLDPVIRDEVVELFYEFTRDEQHSILISSHILSDLEKLCDYIAFLQKGKLLLCEEKDELLSRYCLVQGTPEDIYAIDKSKILSEKHTAYGASAILRREDAPKGMQTSPIGMEELFIAMVKGEH